MQVTPQIIEALFTVRSAVHDRGATRQKTAEAFDVLDDAGVFAEIDDATDYNITPEVINEWGRTL